jgi:hypothetical protein
MEFYFEYYNQHMDMQTKFRIAIQFFNTFLLEI